MTLKTDYNPLDVPFPEYPRPQFKRNSFFNLNGLWRLEKKKTNSKDVTFKGDVLVPFSPESTLSGIGNGFKLDTDEILIYEREFSVDESMMKGVTLLNFGAVDQEATVYLNGKKVCYHKGGFTQFSCDVTSALKLGENVLRVECIDLTEGSQGARGKQSSKPGQIWYTPQSGIWQTVWMESAPKQYIKGIKISTDNINREVEILSDCSVKQTITVYNGDKEILTKEFKDSVTLRYDFELWSPENPKLYDFKISAESGDEITSYFGIRSFGIGKDSNGIARLLLNGKPYFFNGVLDQGYWCDGLLTPPSDKAMLDELTTIKKMGFNMLRKHIKIEPLRWYYYCDKLGITVWQDFVNGGGKYDYKHIAIFPFLGFKHKDYDYKYFSRTDLEGREEFINSVYETVNTLYNCTSIAVWVPFNEGWGQFDSKKITDLVKEIDSSRIIDSVSGWHDQGVGNTELRSLHTYYTPIKVPKDPRPVVLSEFGGYSFKVHGHVFSEEKEFGYKVFKTRESYVEAVESLYLKKLKPLVKKGLCAAVYTQVSDVEEEINGLITYDRKVVKMPVDKMKEINSEIMIEAEKIE